MIAMRSRSSRRLARCTGLRLRPLLEGLESRDVPATWGFAWPIPQAMTISFVPDGTQVGSLKSDLFAVAPKAWGPGWQGEILQALQTWVSHAEINVGLEADDSSPLGTGDLLQGSNNFGDIRVAAAPLPDDVIAISSPFDPAAGTWSGDIVLNSNYAVATTGHSVPDLASVFVHEFGHVFGFPDNQDPSSVEYEYYSGKRTTLSTSDVAALQALYGARQPDSYQGATGNGTLATATSLPFPSQGTSQTIVADVTTPSQTEFYRVTLPAGSDELDVNLKTSGLSLLTASLTVLSGQGQILASTTATDPRSGDLEVNIPHPVPGQTYFLEVRAAAGSAFDVGQYALVIDTLTATDGSLVNAFFQQYGISYLFPILTDGFGSNVPGAMDIMRTLFAQGGDGALLTDNIKQIIDTFLAQATSNTSTAQSVGNLLGQLLGSQGQFQPDPDSISTMIKYLASSGVMKEIVTNLAGSGELPQLLKTLEGSGELNLILDEMVNSGAFSGILQGLMASGQNSALLGNLMGLITTTFAGQSSSSSGQAGAQQINAQTLTSIFKALLQDKTFDSVMSSLITSGVLQGSLQSLPQSTLAGFQQSLVALAAEPTPLGSMLSNLFQSSGAYDPSKPITPQNLVGEMQLLLNSGQLDQAIGALLDQGAFDGIFTQLASSGAIGPIFGALLTSDQGGNVVQALVQSNSLSTMLPLLAQSGALEGLFKGAIQSGSLNQVLQSLNQAGVLQPLFLNIMNSGSLNVLAESLMTSDQFVNELVSLLGSDQLQPILKSLVSSGALTGVINGLVQSGQVWPILQDLLTSGSPGIAAAFNNMVLQFFPTPGDSFASAASLNPSASSQSTDVRTFASIMTLGDASAPGIFKVVVPWTDDGAPGAMIVGAWRDQGSSVQPEVSIFDQNHQPVVAQLLNNGDGNYVVQVRNPVPGSVYYVKVSEEALSNSTTSAVFNIQAIFNDQAIEMDTITQRSIDASSPRVVETFVAPDTRVYHWLLSANSSDPGNLAGGVTLTVLDASGQVYQTINAPNGQGAGIDLLLNAGSYTLVFTPLNGGAVPASPLMFTLSGFAVSDLMKPFPTDTSLQAVGGVGPVSSTVSASQGLAAPYVTSTGIASLSPVSYSFMSTFGVQGGVGSVNLTVARGPTGIASRGMGPTTNMVLGSFDGKRSALAEPRTAHRLASDHHLLQPVATRVAGQAAAHLDNSVPLEPTGSGEALPPIVSLLRSLTVEHEDDGTGMPWGDHSDLLMGMALVGGTSLTQRFRKRRFAAKDRVLEAASEDQGAPDPYKGDRRRSAGHRARLAHPFMPRRVLIVESFDATLPEERHPFQRWLSIDGVEVIQVDRIDWDEVVELRPEMVLLEHCPPALNALDALADRQSHDGARSIPVILFSAPDAAADAAEGLDFGAVDVLSPSIDVKEFRARLRSAVRLWNRLGNLEREASRDGLTGLPNRTALDERLARDWSFCAKNALPITLLVVDIDRFKSVNDAFGHSTGDEVLRRVALALSLSLREGDFSARFGGEEFVVVASDCDAAGAELLAERVRRTIEKIPLDDIPGLQRVTVSIGLACTTEPARTDHEVTLHRADQALYAAKAAGRNTVRSWEETAAQLTEPTSREGVRSNDAGLILAAESAWNHDRGDQSARQTALGIGQS